MVVVLKLMPKNDIINYGKLVGDKLVYLSADNDINLLSSTRTQTRARNLLTNIDQASTIQVSNGNIVINAGHDIHAKAGYIVNSGKEGTTWLQAGHDIRLTTADIEEKYDYRARKDYRITDEKGVVGTEIMAANNIQLVAGHDIKAKTVDITAGNHLGLQAGHDINIGSSTESAYLDEFHKYKDKGFLKSSSEKTKVTIDNTTQKGSELSANSVTIKSGNNLSVTGSQVVGTNDVNLKAGNDIKIDAAEESYYRKEQTIKKKSGLMGSGGIGFTIGKEKESLKQTDTEQTYVGSVVGSTDGSVNIQAGKDIAIKGSDVIAKQDIKLQGENVNIEALDAKTTYNEEYKYKKTGVTVAITGTASDIYQANQTRQQASQQTNSKTKALMDIKAGLQAGNAALETASNLQNNTPSASVGINVSIGSEKTKRTVNQEQHTVVSSSISAGHNATIIATGNGEKDSGDINIIGSQIQAGHDTTLNAKHDINIIGQENTEKTDRKEKSSRGSVSVGYNFGGEKNGFNVSANASQSKSREKGNGTDWTESIVEAGNKLTIVSGNDVNISAGQVKGDTVVANIGHDLNITSQQDSDEYHQKNSSTSVGGSFSYGGTSSVNASGSSTKMDSKWKSVTDQSGIFAGKGGYDITVGNNTDLKGAVIASEADDTRKNRLDTGTISFSDIENKADFKVSSSSAGINTSGMPTPPSSYNNDGNKKSTTHSAVSEGTLIIRDQEGQQQDINSLSRDTEDANHQLKHIFNKDKEQSIIDQTRLVSEIGGQTLTMLNNIDKIQATAKAKKALEEAEAKAQADENNENGGILSDKEKEEIYKKAYDKAMNEGMSAMGSDMRQGVEMAVSLINGIISGDMTGAAAGALAPKIASAIKQATEHYNPETGKTEIDYVANTISHAILGAVVAQLQGNSAIAGGLGAAGSERGAEIIAGILYPDKDIDKLSQEERQTISALTQLATGLATAALGGDTQDVNTAIAGGKNAVENNFFVSNGTNGFSFQQGVVDRFETMNQIYEECMGEPNCTFQKSLDAGLASNFEPLTDEQRKALLYNIPLFGLVYGTSDAITEGDLSNLLEAGINQIQIKNIVSIINAIKIINFTQPNTNKVKGNVEANVDASGKARESSNFREHVNKEREVNASRQTKNKSSTPIINPATNKPVTDHIIVSSGKAPKTSTPNSIYEVSRADGSRSITYYDEKGNWFSREDYGQLTPHGQMGIGSDGRVVPHEHKQTYYNYNGNIYKGKRFYRRIDKDGKPIGDWILDK